MNVQIQKQFVEKLDSNDGSPTGLCACTIFLPNENLNNDLGKLGVSGPTEGESVTVRQPDI